MGFLIAIEIISLAHTLGDRHPAFHQPVEENAAQHGFMTVYQHLCSPLTLPKTKLPLLHYDLLIPFSIGRL